MKHLIKIESTPHGVLGVRHPGLDQQYCEAGELVILKWQPDAKWGLQEAHYTDGDGTVTPIDLTRVKVDGMNVVAFVMPNKGITIGGTFKRFVIEDWTGKDAAFSILGSFDAANLPTLDGFNDAGKIAYVKDTRKYATWDGSDWVYLDGTIIAVPKCLTFTAGAGGASVGFIVLNNGFDIPEDYTKPSLQYSTDGGKTWQDYVLQISDATEDATVIELAEGASVMFKGVNDYLSSYIEEEDDTLSVIAFIDGNVAASGDVTSLLNGVGGDVTVPQYCYNLMFSNCTGLTTAPALPSTTLTQYCYYGMFYGCTGLTIAPVLPANTLANGCYENIFYGCTGITSHDVATLNNSTNTFNENTSCASFTIHAETPPTIGSSTITGLKADCIIYVPAASVDAYKAAQYWSARASYIQAIP